MEEGRERQARGDTITRIVTRTAGKKRSLSILLSVSLLIPQCDDMLPCVCSQISSMQRLQTLISCSSVFENNPVYPTKRCKPQSLHPASGVDSAPPSPWFRPRLPASARGGVLSTRSREGRGDGNRSPLCRFSPQQAGRLLNPSWPLPWRVTVKKLQY